MGNRTRSLFHSSISGSGLLTLNPPPGPNLCVHAGEMEGDEAATTAHALISFPEGRATFSIINYGFCFSQDFCLLLYLVIFSRNLGPIYASSSIILPCFTPAYDYQRLHIYRNSILLYKRKTSIQLCFNVSAHLSDWCVSSFMFRGGFPLEWFGCGATFMNMHVSSSERSSEHAGICQTAWMLCELYLIWKKASFQRLCVWK